jgi:hypothetical protein
VGKNRVLRISTGCLFVIMDKLNWLEGRWQLFGQLWTKYSKYDFLFLGSNVVMSDCMAAWRKPPKVQTPIYSKKA